MQPRDKKIRFSGSSGLTQSQIAAEIGISKCRSRLAHERERRRTCSGRVLLPTERGAPAPAEQRRQRRDRLTPVGGADPEAFVDLPLARAREPMNTRRVQPPPLGPQACCDKQDEHAEGEEVRHRAHGDVAIGRLVTLQLDEFVHPPAEQSEALTGDDGGDEDERW